MLKTSGKLAILLMVLLPALVGVEVLPIVQPALDDRSIEQPNNKILKLQQPIIKMQKKHGSEVNALKEQINPLAGESGEQKAKDELASLQASAKTKDVKPVIPEEKPENDNPVFFANNNSEETIAPKWLPYFNLTTKASDDRQIGRFNFMYPLSQSPDSMIFTDVRATFDNDNSTEANLGLGFRRIMPGDHNNEGWIWGVYGFYDRLKSPKNNYFNQIMLGAELLKTNFELRGNVYIPDDTSYVVGRNTASSASLSGTTVMERTLSIVARERALPGVDAEVGYGFDIGKKDKLWIYAGYFFFDHSDTPEIAGPRLRLQYEWNDAFALSGSTFGFGVEVQHDRVRETDTFASVIFSIPIGSQRKSRRNSSKWRSIESRMMRPVIRDIDVVTFAEDMSKAPGSTGGPEIDSHTETPLIDPTTDQQVDIYFVTANGSATGAGTQDDPMTIVQAEGASGVSDVLLLLNDDGNIDVSGASGGTLTLKSYQQLLGIGDNTSKDVLLPKNLTLTVSSTAGRPNLTRASGASVVTLLWNNTLDGIAISGGNNGVYGVNGNNPTIGDVAIQNTGSYGIFLNNNSGTVSISECVIQNSTYDAIYVANTAGGTVSIDVHDNDILSNGGQGIYIQNSNGSTATVDVIDNQITGNTDEGLYIYNLTGGTLTATVRDNLISGNDDDNIRVLNSASTLNLTLNDNDITNSITDAGVNISSTLAGSIFSGNITNNRITGNNDQGLRPFNSGDSFSLTVQNNTITGNQAGGIDYDTDSGTTTLTIENNTISSNSGGVITNDIGIAIDQDSGIANTLTLILRNNLIDDNGYTSVWIDNSDGTFNASLQDNSITNNGLNGVYVINRITGVLTANFYNNTITGNASRGLYFYNTEGTFNASLQGNSITNNGLNGVYVINRTTGVLTADFYNNTITGNASRGLYFYNTAGTFNASLQSNSITNNAIDGAYVANLTTGVLTASFYNNTVTGNAARGIWLNNNAGTLNALFENNTIAINVGDGLELDNAGGGVFDYDLGGGTLGSVGLNSIFANSSGFDIDNDTGVSIKAENNWWGVAPPNPARVAGTVDFDPWLTSDPN